MTAVFDADRKAIFGYGDRLVQIEYDGTPPCGADAEWLFASPFRSEAAGEPEP